MGKDNIRIKYYELMQEFDRYKEQVKKDKHQLTLQCVEYLSLYLDAIDQLQRIKEIVK